VLVLCDNVGEDGVFSWRNLLWKIDVLRQSHLALLEWAGEVDVLNGIAKIGGLSDDRDKTILDRQVDFGALLYVLAEVARGSNAEGVAAVDAISDLWPVR